VTTLLRFIGEAPERDGLRDTPARVVKAWREMTAGYAEDPAEILSRTFDESSDVTSAMLGTLRTDVTSRAEFLRLTSS